MKRLALAFALLALPTLAHAEHVSCYGVLSYMPVHDPSDPELRNGRAMLRNEDKDGNVINYEQSDRCSTTLVGKALAKVAKTCKPNELCYVEGIVSNGDNWVKIERVTKP
jgi:hypothetical protein